MTLDASLLVESPLVVTLIAAVGTDGKVLVIYLEQPCFYYVSSVSHFYEIIVLWPAVTVISMIYRNVAALYLTGPSLPHF